MLGSLQPSSVTCRPLTPRQISFLSPLIIYSFLSSFILHPSSLLGDIPESRVQVSQIRLLLRRQTIEAMVALTLVAQPVLA